MSCAWHVMVFVESHMQQQQRQFIFILIRRVCKHCLRIYLFSGMLSVFFRIKETTKKNENKWSEKYWTFSWNSSTHTSAHMWCFRYVFFVSFLFLFKLEWSTKSDRRFKSLIIHQFIFFGLKGTRLLSKRKWTSISPKRRVSRCLPTMNFISNQRRACNKLINENYIEKT